MIPRTTHPKRPARTGLNPRGQSCLPCREHKVHCNRELPCRSCIRRGREEACRKHPSSAILGISQAATQRTQLRIEPRGAPLANRTPPEAEALPIDHGDFSVPASSPMGVSGFLLLPGNAPDGQASSPQLQSVETLLRFNAITKLCGARQASSPESEVRPDQSIPPAATRQLDGDAVLSFGLEPDAGSMMIQLLSLLPSHSQCDVLVSWYYDHGDWVHRALHVPSFRSQYTRFWTLPVLEVDFIWLSLLFVMISVSAQRMPSATCPLGLHSQRLRQMAHVWFRASEKSLQAGRFESRLTLTQLQTFIVSQLYYFQTNGVEALNSWVAGGEQTFGQQY